MKVVTLIARIILGLVFLIFGLNGFLNFLHGPLPPGDAGVFAGVLTRSHYVWLVAGTQVVAGALLLINRFVPFALVLSAALIVNILTFHAAMAPGSIGMGIVVAILWIILAVRFRAYFAPLFTQKALVDRSGNGRVL